MPTKDTKKHEKQAVSGVSCDSWATKQGEGETMSEGTQAELHEVAGRIRGWQEERRLSDSQMLRDFPGLGSSKTYVRIVSGDCEELDCSRWLRDYAAVWSLIQLLAESSQENDEIYPDLTTVTDLRKAVADAMREGGNNRLVLVQGPSGSGKTTAARFLQAKYGARIVFCEATEIWKENMNAALAGICTALGVREPPMSVSARFDLAVTRLRESRCCLVVDEAHHLGPKTLNLVKSLLNQTPGEFVLLAMGTLWTRLETSAYAEARQLTQNRLSERLRYDGVEVTDVERVLERRLGMNGDAKAAAKSLAAAARSHGTLAFVRLVCRQARKLAGKEQATGEHVARAAALVAGSR